MKIIWYWVFLGFITSPVFWKDYYNFIKRALRSTETWSRYSVIKKESKCKLCGEQVPIWFTNKICNDCTIEEINRTHIEPTKYEGLD